ncbi:putative MFS family arabinose efflux permease [Murinocardiopsis flavida]|uniref:Putative MFS family arabinose efflux permease n=1 Tax=Murinocardiopsis flavida TaxID=645275 RepID=A0A2P8DUC7_9ACTN|nr:MFS transporter [Murinocardiopsis flavida]PSL00821.1 putative MFS family arabinose efflux permease [Murinocardiopsis flavida]
MLRSYRRIFEVPDLLPILIWSMLARLHLPGMPIALTFLVADWTGSYGLAGIAVGALTLGNAIAGPLRGRMADRGATDRIMVLCGLVFASGLTVIALLPAALWWASVPLALATGLFQPPAGQVARALWPRLTTGSVRQTMYATESTVQELLFVVGPLLAAAMVAVSGGRVAVLVLAGVSLSSSIAFALVLRRTGHAGAVVPEGGPQSGPRRSLLRSRSLILLFALMLLLVAGLGAVDLVIVAWGRELGSPGVTGGLAAIWALGSAVGGFVAGALTRPPRLARRAAAAALGVAVLVPLLPPFTSLSPWLISPVLFAAGLAIAPTLAAATSLIGEIAPEERRAEAFGWLNTAVATGLAGSAPVAGWLLDVAGVAAGVGAAAVAMALAAVLSLLVPGPPGAAGAAAAPEPDRAA